MLNSIEFYFAESCRTVLYYNTILSIISQEMEGETLSEMVVLW